MIQYLTINNVPYWSWGRGNAKTLGDLWRELESGECTLSVRKGVVIRRVVVSSVYVYYKKDKVTWRLVEQRQVFADGRSRTRPAYLGVGEKRRPNEDAEVAARRALKEELGIVDPKIVFKPLPKEVWKPTSSTTYPGTVVDHNVDMFEVFIPARLYKPEGYIEQQCDKTSYFAWVPIARRLLVHKDGCGGHVTEKNGHYECDGCDAESAEIEMESTLLLYCAIDDAPLDSELKCTTCFEIHESPRPERQ